MQTENVKKKSTLMPVLRNIKWIFVKELHSFFGQNLPPFAMGIFAFLAGLVSVIVASSGSITYESLTRALFYFFYLIIMIVSVVLSLPSFVGEKRQGTLELLRTLPVTDTELVIGKFLPGILYVFIMSFSLTAVYILFIAEGPLYIVMSGFPGLILVGMYAYSVGIFASSLSGNYLISLLISSGILLLIDIGGFLGGLLPEPSRSIVSHLHIVNQFGPFTKGVIPFKGVVVFISLCVLFLFFTVKNLESRRWRNNDI